MLSTELPRRWRVPTGPGGDRTRSTLRGDRIRRWRVSVSRDAIRWSPLAVRYRGSLAVQISKSRFEVAHEHGQILGRLRGVELSDA